MLSNRVSLRGKYEILSLLKTTNLAQTYLAVDNTTGKKVIIKSSNILQKHEEAFRNYERLKSEAKILMKLNHPSIVRYLTSWEEGCFFYLVTEYVPAKSMKEAFSSMPPDREFVIEYMIQLLDVVEYLHFKKIIHRDIKPSNILLGDTVILLDFNAAVIDSSDEKCIAVMGTPGYQCPESFRRIVSNLTDIYSLGATLLFLLTGETPSCNFASFRNLARDADLLSIAFRAMNSDLEKRFKTAFEMKQTIKALSSYQARIVTGSKHFKLDKDFIALGRDESADYRIDDPFKHISPIHTIIDRIGNNYVIENKGTNGTFLYRNEGYIQISRETLQDGEFIVLCYRPERGPYKIFRFRNEKIYSKKVPT